MRPSLLLLLCLGAAACPRPAQDATTDPRATSPSAPKEATANAPRPQAPKPPSLATFGGTITEIVFALGEGDRVVATDTSSTWPEEVSALPRVGYFRKLSAEGILATSPKVVLGYEEIGPKGVVEQLQGAGLTVKLFENEEGVAPAIARIREIATYLKKTERAEALVTALEHDLARVKARRVRIKTPPRALFIYARGPNVLMVSGTKTAAHEMLTLAGATNAASGFEGFKPLTPEAVVAAQPTHLIMPTKGAKSIGGIQGVLTLPGVGATPAGLAKRLVTVDDLKLLGFGPRMGRALLELQDKLGIEDIP